MAIPAILGVAGYFYSERQDPVYEAKGTLLVKGRASGLSVENVDFRLSSNLAATYSKRITSTPFLEQVELDKAILLGASSLSGMVSSNTAINPPVVQLMVRHRDPNVAATVAQIVSEAFIDFTIEQKLADIARVQSAAAAQGISNTDSLVAAQFAALDTLELLEPVFTPGSPIIPRTERNVIAGVLIGFLLATAFAFVLENMTDTVRSPELLAEKFGVSPLGSLFKWNPRDKEPSDLILWSEPASGFAEALRQIRANVQFATANLPSKIFLVTSPGPSEGKTTIVSNLAVAMAQTGKRVVLIDADLRRPAIHSLFPSVKRDPGLSNYLVDLESGLEPEISPAEEGGVDLITSGPRPPNPTELLGSQKMKTLLDDLAKTYDAVFIDSPPVLVAADSSVLASHSDAVVVVVDGSSTKSSALQAALSILKATDVNLTGVIINKLKRPYLGYGYGYPYYYHHYYYSHGASDTTYPRFYQRLAQRIWSTLPKGRR